MTSRRRFLTAIGSLAAVGAATEFVTGLFGVKRFLTQSNLPDLGQVQQEFRSGDVTQIDRLVVSTSEAKWLQDNHPKVREPNEIIKLLHR